LKITSFVCVELNVFVGAFGKLRKATISFIVSVYPSDRPHGTRLSLGVGDFHEVWFFFESCRENSGL